MKKFLEEFKDFALKGNVMDLAVAVIIGGAFQSIINSVVNDLIMPIIGWLFGGLDFTNLYIPLKSKDFVITPATIEQVLVSSTDVSGGDVVQSVVKTPAVTVGNATLAQLEEAGIGVFKYGAFITAVINFILMALVIFLLVKGINKLTSLGASRFKKGKKDAPAAPTTKVCPYCKSEIDIKATRCPHCTSQLDEKPSRR